MRMKGELERSATRERELGVLKEAPAQQKKKSPIPQDMTDSLREIRFRKKESTPPTKKTSQTPQESKPTGKAYKKSRAGYYVAGAIQTRTNRGDGWREMQKLLLLSQRRDCWAGTSRSLHGRAWGKLTAGENRRKSRRRSHRRREHPLKCVKGP